MNIQDNVEHLHNDVFGETFALYNKSQMEEFIAPFKIRFEKNHIDPIDVFAGKTCLDAGCGNGRGSLFMSLNGASKVYSLDISNLNVESSRKNAEIFGFSNKIHVQQSSLEKIPFEDEFFDFVWCNGVIMHTHNPSACLKELARVLKTNGKAWIYVYGAGGVYWYCVYKFRYLLKDYSEKDCLEVLKFMQTPTGFLAEYMDDWKAPYLRTYTNKDFSSSLSSLGFINCDPLLYGTDYDTSHRINCYLQDRDYLGEGDLRYLITKTANKMDFIQISHTEYGSKYEYSKLFTDAIDKKFDLLALKINTSLVRTLLAFAFLQRHLRDQIFSVHKPFDLRQYLSYFDKVLAYLDYL